MDGHFLWVSEGGGMYFGEWACVDIFYEWMRVGGIFRDVYLFIYRKVYFRWLEVVGYEWGLVGVVTRLSIL